VSRHEYAFWWVAGGINPCFRGTFNLLRIRYGSLAPGIIYVCLIVNLLMLLYEIRLETNNLDFITIPRALLAVFQIAATAFQCAGASFCIAGTANFKARVFACGVAQLGSKRFLLNASTEKINTATMHMSKGTRT
jgi:hypothetical protein